MTSGSDRAAAVAARYGLTSADDIDAVVTAYRAVARFSGPFLTSVAVDILDGLREDAAADPRRTALFLGRDGLPLAAAVHALDPRFAASRTRTVTLSRHVLELALRDIERYRDGPLSLPAAFRITADGDTGGAARALGRYLADNDIPTDRPGSAVTVVDTSYKGTSQEMLAAAFPETSFTGRYAFFGAHPDDPHPGTKTGHVVHRDPDPAGGFPLRAQLPAQVSETFAHIEAIAAIEDVHHGPAAKPVRWGSTGPTSAPLESTRTELRDLNPARVALPYRDLRVREATHAAVLLAVADSAESAAVGLRAGDPDWRAEVDAASRDYVGQLRSWISTSDPARRRMDPDLAVVLDGFAHRTERQAVHHLTAELESRGHARESHETLWIQLATSNNEPERDAVIAGAVVELDAASEQLVSMATPASAVDLEMDRGVDAEEIDVDWPDYGIDEWDDGLDLDD